jgi:hypothetical protein
LNAACCSCIFVSDAAACWLVTARSKPVVEAGPFGAAAAALVLAAPGFAKPPLVAGPEDAAPAGDDGFANPPLVGCDSVVCGGETVGAVEPGLVNPPLDGEVEDWGNSTLPHPEPLLWLDMNRP